MAKRMCTVEGCDGPVIARSYCNTHYRRWLKDGDPRPDMPRKQKLTPERFWAQTRPEGACVVWTGCPDRNGYGAVRWERKTVKAHRLAFFLRMGRWPNGPLRHLCNNPPCVLHVVEGTHSENMRDAVAAGTHFWAKKTHCPRGHAYDEHACSCRDRRHCRACMSERYRERTREAG